MIFGKRNCFFGTILLSLVFQKKKKNRVISKASTTLVTLLNNTQRCIFFSSPPNYFAVTIRSIICKRTRIWQPLLIWMPNCCWPRMRRHVSMVIWLVSVVFSNSSRMPPIWASVNRRPNTFIIMLRRTRAAVYFAKFLQEFLEKNLLHLCLAVRFLSALKISIYCTEWY